jgi:hypothetical protein
MRRITIMGALVAVLATSALAAETASAKSLKLDLTHEFGTIQIKPGDEFNLVTHEVTITTNTGNVECSGEGSILGTDLTNDAKTANIELKHTTGSLGGESSCLSSVFGLGSRAQVYMEPLSGARLGTLGLGSKGKAQVKSNSGQIDIYFNTANVDCNYSFAKLKGSVNATPSVAAVEVKFAKQKLKVANSFRVCPQSATLTVPFNYSLTNANQETIFEHIHS